MFWFTLKRLEGKLSHPDYKVAVQAIHELAESKDPRAVPVMVKMLEQREESYDYGFAQRQVEAIKALQQLGDPTVKPFLVSLLLEAVLELEVKVGEPRTHLSHRTREVLESLGWKPASLIERFAVAFDKCGKEAILDEEPDLLIQLLEDPRMKTNHRLVLARSLLERQDGRGVIPLLQERLWNELGAGGESLARWLLALFPWPSEGFAARFVPDEEGRHKVQSEARGTLTHYFDKSHTVGPLIEALKSGLPERQVVAMAVVAWNKQPEVIDLLPELMEDPDPVVRRKAAITLGMIGDRRAADRLAAMLPDLSGHDEEEVAVAMGVLEDPRAFDALVRVARRALPGFHHVALGKLEKLKDPRVVDLLLELARSEGQDVIRFSLLGLGHIKDDAALEGIIGFLDDQERNLFAIEALGMRGDSRAIEPLAARLEGMKPSDPRYDATALALSRLGDWRLAVHLAVKYFGEEYQSEDADRWDHRHVADGLESLLKRSAGQMPQETLEKLSTIHAEVLFGEPHGLKDRSDYHTVDHRVPHLAKEELLWRERARKSGLASQGRAGDA